MSGPKNERPLALIAGGTGDIGRAIATRLSRDGFRVGLLGLHVPDGQVNAFLASLPGEGHAWAECDLSQADSVKEAVRALASKGSVFACIQSASPPIERTELEQASKEEKARQFGVHVDGTRFLFQEVAERMDERGGRLVGITTAALNPALKAKRMGAYLAAKAQMVEVMREMAKDLAPRGITVNAVAPSFVATHLNSDLPARLADFVREANPMKRNIVPEDIAAVVSFLCSEDARAITGVSIPVSGGEFMTL